MLNKSNTRNLVMNLESNKYVSSLLNQFSFDGEIETVTFAYIDLLYIRILCSYGYIYLLNITYPCYLLFHQNIFYLNLRNAMFNDVQ